jgi:hypothetical protein
MRAEAIASLMEYMTPAEKVEVMAILARDGRKWRPLPGPQTMAYNSEADVIGYGGAAGGGKTDLACGLALTEHENTMILRREAPQLRGIVDRLTKLIGNKVGYNGQEKVWRLPDRQIEFGSVQHAGDVTKYQGRPHDLLVFDEATNFLEAQVRFLLGWLRTTTPGQRCRALLTFNPPTDAEGRWVISFFAPWLDDKHPNPAKPGELRWFANVAGKDVEVPDGRAFVVDDDGEMQTDFNPAHYLPVHVIRPMSRTFIPSRVSDNPFLMGTGYMTTLQSMPEPLRSQMLMGDFQAGVEDNVWQVIPTAWAKAAQDRWQERFNKGDMDSMGVDVSRGGKDETVIARRHGPWFDKLVIHPGMATPDGPTLFAQVLQVRRDRAPVHIDIVGVGSSPFDFMVTNNVQAIALNGASKAFERSKGGNLPFANLRAQLYWKMREALDPTNPRPIFLPPDSQLLADLCAPTWKLAAGGILVESKEDIAKRIGRSPDRGDAVCYALVETVKTDVMAAMKRQAAYDPYRDM